jgi:hypothetical protein
MSRGTPVDSRLPTYPLLSHHAGFMIHRLRSLVGAALSVVPLFASQPSIAQQPGIPGERVPPSAISPLVLESMEVVMERDRTRPKDPTPLGVWNGENGRWFVPPETAKAPAHSGHIAIVNEWGDSRMGIGFGA